MSAEANAVSRQGMLFGDPLEGLETDEVGYRGPIACNAAGITYRQLDSWARTGLLQPSIRAARGSGSQRLYSFRDILVLKVVKNLLPFFLMHALADMFGSSLMYLLINWGS